MLHKTLIAPVLAGVVATLLFMGCSELVDQAADSVKMSDVAVAVRYSPQSSFAQEASSAKATIETGDSTLEQELTLSDSLLSGIILDVPVGDGQLLDIGVYNQEGLLIYTGKNLIDIVDSNLVKETLELFEVDSLGVAIPYGDTIGELIWDDTTADYFDDWFDSSGYKYPGIIIDSSDGVDSSDVIIDPIDSSDDVDSSDVIIDPIDSSDGVDSSDVIIDPIDVVDSL